MTVMREPLTTKAAFYRAYFRGQFGNRPRVWKTVTDIPADVGGIMLRARSVSAAVVREYPSLAALHAALATIDQRNVTFNETAPDHKVLLQGEVLRSPTGLMLFAAERCAPLRMRDALARHGRTTTGLTALLLLQRYLWPSSYADVMEVLDMYPDHVVEFSAYSCRVGALRGRNHFLWECRLY